MRYVPIEASFYSKNRKIIASKMKTNSMAVFTANAVYKSSGDGEAGFRQNSSFFYLTGIDQEDCKLLIYKSDTSFEEFLFVAETNEKIKIWEGDKLSKEQATGLSGIENVFFNELFWDKLKHIGKEVRHIYLHLDKVHEKKAAIQTIEKQLNTRIRKYFSSKKFENLAPCVSELRCVKDPREIVQIKKAIEISNVAFNFFAKVLMPGLAEYQIEADLNYHMTRLGSRFPAFQTILASGSNACVLHYIKNDAICKEGDIVLLDFGAEYGGYNADITRVVPVSGTFSSRQAEVYNAVYEVLIYLKKYSKPGEKLTEIRKEAREIIGKKLVDLKLVPKATEENISKYFPHGPSHFLGLDVHDVGEKDQKLKENMLITCEPGIYIPEESLGIRLENDLLLTKSGNIDLCAAIPITLKDIENLKNA
jgi:Xaa-Pro aminopeptidase